MNRPPRLRLIQGGRSTNPAHIHDDQRRRHALAAARWLREGAEPPRLALVGR